MKCPQSGEPAVQTDLFDMVPQLTVGRKVFGTGTSLVCPLRGWLVSSPAPTRNAGRHPRPPLQVLGELYYLRSVGQNARCSLQQHHEEPASGFTSGGFFFFHLHMVRYLTLFFGLAGSRRRGSGEPTAEESIRVQDKISTVCLFIHSRFLWSHC